jgi:FMN phosphatase YigB (HAD superfamily)
MRRVSVITAPPTTPISGFLFPAPAPLESISLKVGVMAHVFYADLIDEFVSQLSHIPVPFVLMVSVVTEADRKTVLSKFSAIELVSELHVRLVPNRGRDLAPMLVTYRQEILSLDVVCHIHTKKSLYTGSEKKGWRQYLIESLLGSRARVAWILGMLQATKELGMVYPESYRSVPLIAHTWLSNKEHARILGDQLGIAIDGDAYLDFSTGSMFWVRVDALRPLYELDFGFDDFPEEKGQADGTLQHALERMLAQLVRHQRMVIGILPTDQTLRLGTEGARNWKTYFDLPVRDRISIGAIDASVVSFDIFDTLVLRPFLRPSGARAYLAELVRQEFGIEDFLELRERAETAARQLADKDVDSRAVYETLARMTQGRNLPVADIHALELATERRLLRPRQAVADAARHIGTLGKSVIAVSDMYLGRETLRSVLPEAISSSLEEIHVSCDSGWRKDTCQTWHQLPAQLGVDRNAWLHVGDNEHSDIQLPHDLGFLPPVHVLRPSALFDVVPALRPLRPSHEQAAHWPNQLMTGLIGNRLAELADTDPRAFDDTLALDDPETVGYLVLGPMILDYLAWVNRLAVAESTEKILFLSREGYLLQQAYETMHRAAGGNGPSGVYLLASRRGVGTPSIREISDLDYLLEGTYTGSLYALLEARTGKKIADAAQRELGEAALSKDVFLPEMRVAIIKMMQPLTRKILEIAEQERNTYLGYWKAQVGDSSALVSDVGYAGTIQSHLSRLLSRGLGGAYFALTEKAEKVSAGGGWAKARYCDLRESPLARCPILEHDLLLERFLTSPDGQFSHFEPDDHGLRAVFAAKTQLDFGSVERLHRGANDFVSDACTVVGADVMKLTFDGLLVQRPLRCLATGLWRSHTWLSKLTAEDHFTGRGEVLLPGCVAPQLKSRR